MASTYRCCFKKNKQDIFYVKENFEVFPFCQSKYEHADSNILNRLRNSFIEAINAQGRLPRFVVIILDDDILEFINYEDQGVSTLMGNCVEWLVNQFNDLIKLAKESTPSKAVKDGFPQLYWVAPPHHRNFTNNSTRTKFINVMESTFKLHKDSRIIKMKEVWDYNNTELINSNGQFTNNGWDTYWISVDAAIKFNIAKRDLYLTNQARIKANGSINVAQPNKRRFEGRDDMTRFFKKHKTSKNSKGHSNNWDHTRRKLPSPKRN